MNFCKHCGIQHPASYNYCPTEAGVIAGTPYFDVSRRIENFCPSCGKEAHTSAEYCIHCGSTFSIVEPKKGAGGRTVAATTVTPVLPKGGTGLSGLFSLSNFSKAQIVPVIISILLTFALLAGTIIVVKSGIDDLLVRTFDNEYSVSELSKLEPISEMINMQTEEETVKFPSVYNFFTYIPWIHAIDFELSTSISYDDDRSNALLTFQNMSVIFIPLLLLVLGVGGWVLGWQVKKNQLPFLSSLMLFSLGYALLVLVSTIIAAFSLKARFMDFWETPMQFALSMSYSWLEAFIVPFLVALLVGGLFAHFAIYKKQSFAPHVFAHSVFRYGALALSVLIGLAVVYHVISFAIGANLVTYIENENGDGKFLATVLFGAPIAFMLLKAGHFIPSLFTVSAYDESESVSLKLWDTDQFLISDFAKEFELDEWLFTGFPFWYHLLFLIPIVALVATGYYLFKTIGINWIEVALFSATYGFLFALITSMGNINLVTSAGDYSYISEFLPYQIDIGLTSNLFTTFFFSFLIAAVSLVAGLYLRKWMMQRA